MFFLTKFNKITPEIAKTITKQEKEKQQKEFEHNIQRLMAKLEKSEQTEQTKQQKELERSKKEWDQYFRDNQGKIKREFPKSIFDK
jgi:hypothetical protein